MNRRGFVCASVRPREAICVNPSLSPSYDAMQAVTKDSTAHLGVSATASVFTKREHTDVSEFMSPTAGEIIRWVGGEGKHCVRVHEPHRR